jgi:hypothetical protein
MEGYDLSTADGPRKFWVESSGEHVEYTLHAYLRMEMSMYTPYVNHARVEETTRSLPYVFGGISKDLRTKNRKDIAKNC